MAFDYITNDGVSFSFFARMDSAPQGAQRKGRNISVPGQNGIALRREEKVPDFFPGHSEVYVDTTAFNAGDAAVLATVYNDLVGQIVSLRIQNVVYPNIYVSAVKINQHMPLVAIYFGCRPNGTDISDDAYLVTAEWEFIYAGVVP